MFDIYQIKISTELPHRYPLRAYCKGHPVTTTTKNGVSSRCAKVGENVDIKMDPSTQLHYIHTYGPYSMLRSVFLSATKSADWMP